jgi:anti-sigma regulatory factor (Ser/Thr protein kinase)
LVTVSTVSPARRHDGAFRHEAMFYAGTDEFLDGTLTFIREGLAGGEPVLVVVDAPKIDLLRNRLGADARAVRFADMADIGFNPARIIPAWCDFVETHAGRGRPFRGIGEPVNPGRRPAELVECQRHESLLNLAFADAPAWSLLCPYDTEALAPAVVEEARRSHRYLVHGHDTRVSDDFLEEGTAAGSFEDPLPEPETPPEEYVFGPGPLGTVRQLVARHAARAGLGMSRMSDLVLAVNEVATNSLTHGGGHGMLWLWQDGEALVCEVRDRGRITEPLIGRRLPTTDDDGGRGLWLANQLCDLVQIRSSAAGTVVRMHMWR